MKKALILILTIILSLSLFACGGEKPSFSTGNFLPEIEGSTGYEKLVYAVSETGASADSPYAQEGTLVLVAERLAIDSSVIMPSFSIKDNEFDVNSTNEMDVSKNYIVLSSTLEFGGDQMQSYTICTPGFSPLYSYKSLIIKAEKDAWTGKPEDKPNCVSYYMFTTYTEGTAKASSIVLRQKEYGQTDYKNWEKIEMNYDNLSNGTSAFWDPNQMYYAIRGIKNLHENKFQYSFFMPLAVEKGTKLVIASSKNKQSAERETFPYIKNKYESKPDANFTYTLVNIIPSGAPVTGSGIQVYYCEQALHSNTQQDLTATGRCPRVPILIMENFSVNTTGVQNNPRGAIIYRLKDLVSEK